MQFLADENVDRPIVEKLRMEGYDVSYITEISPGIADDSVLKKAFEKEMILLTKDKDFGELVFYKHQKNTGVILIRLEGVNLTTQTEIVFNLIQKNNNLLKSAFTVVSHSGVRIRKG